ncbi:MAG: hypothetical protein K2Z81_09240, partial [Cyanobacteria bacterium]|nr:hypothetical protein [Cyanobacteriota bacterium]
MFIRNMPDVANGKAHLSQLTLSLGWLEDGSSTTTPDPQRRNSADALDECYAAFVNCPAGKRDFYFAGVTDSPALISTRRFRELEPTRLCSAVYIQAKIDYLYAPEKVVSSNDHNGNKYVRNYGDDSASSQEAQQANAPGTNQYVTDYRMEEKREKVPKSNISHSILVTAAALPPCAPDQGAAGALVVSLPQGAIKEYENLTSLFADVDVGARSSTQCLATRGDYPLDPSSELLEKARDLRLGDRKISEALAQSLFSWLKTNRGRERLSDIIETMKAPFDKLSEFNSRSFVIFDFDKLGGCTISRKASHAYYRHTVSDQQSIDTAYDLLETEKGMLGLVVRNQVFNGSPTKGGKHAGQPLFSELPVDYERPSSREKEIMNAGNPILEEYRRKKPRLGELRYRNSYLKGGLAVSLELFAGHTSAQVETRY